MELVEKWEIEGKSLMQAGTISTGILISLKIILLPNLNALIMQLWNSRDFSRVP